MNVSITEDATISRTRSDVGATVVRVDAIATMPARGSRRFKFDRAKPPPCDESIAESTQCQRKIKIRLQAALHRA
jgi:hypothetical protein